MIKEETLNKIHVKPLTITNQDTSPIKGSELFPSLYFNLFICSKKRSGKTSLINTIIQKCTDKRTLFFIFCPTINVDSSWKAMIQYLENRGNVVKSYSDILDGKVNILNEIVNQLSIGDEEDEKEEVFKSKIKFDELKKKKAYVPKKLSPEVCFIFDDASDILRNPAVSILLKKNRHLKANTIISSQYLHDLQPSSIKQLDYFIAFRSFSEDKLALIHKGLDLSIEFLQLWNIYTHCTNKAYSFLYINVRSEQYRCNFNKKIELDI